MGCSVKSLQKAHDNSDQTWHQQEKNSQIPNVKPQHTCENFVGCMLFETPNYTT